MGYSDDGESGCTFGCHLAIDGRRYSNEQLAHQIASPPITLRIDSAKTAVTSVISLASQAAGSLGNIKITSAMPASACSSLKAKWTVEVIYTTYLPIYNNNQSWQGFDWTYTDLVLPVAASLSSNLQGCASSPSRFFEATDGPTLISAMQTLFANTVSSARLTK
jgi:hypothetical protein